MRRATMAMLMHSALDRAPHPMASIKARPANQSLHLSLECLSSKTPVPNDRHVARAFGDQSVGYVAGARHRTARETDNEPVRQVR